ncbi:MAG TPA: hypothetical protein PLJ29_11815 [Leptospiraceae bacterium]|nr:hypothetical protein [Leptospiraceae bacterium]HNI27040.1 hypothetical protein [Leptospiraceae bacterium]
MNLFPYSILKYFIIILFLSVVLCSDRKKMPEFKGDYDSYIKESALFMCAKIRECNPQIYRTFPEEYRDRKECETGLLNNWDEKIKNHREPEKQMLMKDCISKVMKSDCKDFLYAGMRTHSCLDLYMRLQNESKEVLLKKPSKESEQK